MTRNQFIARLKEVGFINGSITYAREDMRHKWDYYYEASESREIGIIVCSNKDLFICGETAYTFDELEQFLIDKGIVEKPCTHPIRRFDYDGNEYCAVCNKGLGDFSAHEYLIRKGCQYSENFGGSYWRCDWAPKIYLEVDEIVVSENDNLIWADDKITKQSCDKAIKLVDFLIELEIDDA